MTWKITRKKQNRCPIKVWVSFCLCLPPGCSAGSRNSSWWPQDRSSASCPQGGWPPPSVVAVCHPPTRASHINTSPLLRLVSLAIWGKTCPNTQWEHQDWLTSWYNLSEESCLMEFTFTGCTTKLTTCLNSQLMTLKSSVDVQINTCN